MNSTAYWEGVQDRDKLEHLNGQPPVQEPEQPAEFPHEDTSGIQFLDLQTLENEGIPEVEWIVDRWLAKRDVVMFAGAGGLGKSTTSANLAESLARGESWCSQPVTGAVRVLYIDEEQDELTCARLFLRLGGHHENLRVACGQGIRFDNVEDVVRVESAIRAFKPAVVVCDSVQQVFGSADENSATQIGNVYRHLFRLRDTYGCAFVLVHHRRKQQPGTSTEALELVRGSTAHGTQASSVWYSQPGSPNTMHLIQAKRRGASKTSLVIEYEEAEDGKIILTGNGPVEDPEGVLERAAEWITLYMTDHIEAKTSEIKSAGEIAGHNERGIERALKHLKKLGVLDSPKRGLYRKVT